MMPAATRVALLVNSTYPSSDTIVKDMQAAALSRGLQLHILRASTDAEIEAAFAGFAELNAGVLIMGTDPFFNGQIGRLANLALRYAVPMIYQTLYSRRQEVW